MKARELLIKSKIYRAIAIVFALAGLVLFAFVFSSRSEGDVLSIMEEPASVVLLVFPFIPALLFSWISKRAESKLQDMLDEAESPSKPAKK